MLRAQTVCIVQTLHEPIEPYVLVKYQQKIEPLFMCFCFYILFTIFYAGGFR